MKEETNNTIIYTAQDIQKYLSGGCTPAEMHAMEKAALDDAFLAEAMEGFEEMKGQNWENELAAARVKIASGNVAKVVPFGKNKNDWWKVAAAVLILGGGSLMVYNATKRSTETTTTKSEIAQVNVHTDPIQKIDTDTPAGAIVQQPAVTNTATATEVPHTTTVSPTLTEPAILPQRNAADRDVVAILKDTTEGRRKDDFVYRPSASADKYIAANKPVAENKYDADEAVREKQQLASNATADQYKNNQAGNTQANSYNNITQEQQLNRSKTMENATAKKAAATAAVQYNHPFNAQVLGADNQPLPFANVSIKSEHFGTYADVKGNFRLVSTDSFITVQVKSVGYLPRQFVLKSNGQQNKLVLSEDEVAIQDVTVIRGKVSGTTTRRARLVRDSVVNVEPADGWDNYSTYISNNIDPYGALINESAHGEMEISFRVKSDYTITDIKIDNSLCNNCNEEAVKKLIEQGPQWKTKKGKGGKAKIKVQF